METLDKASTTQVEDGKQKKQNQKKEKPKKEKSELPQKEKQAIAVSGDTPVKTKAELKAERRALQEAQRAAKAAAKSQQSTGAQKKVNPQSGQNVQPKKIDNQPPVKPKATSETTGFRVAYNVQMDDEKVQKHISKKLAKQQVPQRKTTQKKVDLFSHLHQYEKDISLTKDISFSSGNIHPAIIKLGLQYAEGVITGSNARCIALLCALKEVINDYVTPPSKELSRDLETKIKPCISFLSQCRHLSVSMGNAIKYLKQQITQTPPGMPENEAKSMLIENIDDFINERIILAGRQISILARTKIQNGDKILIYGFSSLVVQILKDAKENKKEFEIVVVDCRPDFPGRESIKRLAEADIKCSYVLINAVSYIMKEVTTVLLGAHALLANGNVMSRSGCSMVAMVAKANNVPVLACCETYKFCERVQTDSFVFNELGDPDALVHLKQPNQEDILSGWREMENLHLLNLVYDVTPSDLVDMAVTELGMIPCTSVPVVLRVKSTEKL